MSIQSEILSSLSVLCLQTVCLPYSEKKNKYKPEKCWDEIEQSAISYFYFFIFSGGGFGKPNFVQGISLSWVILWWHSKQLINPDYGCN